MRSRLLVVLILLLMMGAAAWLLRRPLDQPFVVSGFVEADRARVGSRVGGRVAEVMVREGQRVAAGETLYRLEAFDLEQQLAEAEAQAAAADAEMQRLKEGYRAEEIAQAQAARDRARAVLEKRRSGPRPQELSVAREQLRQAEATLELARLERDRILPLVREQSMSQLELDRAEKQLVSADAGLAIARQQLALLEEGTRKEEIAEAEAQLAETEALLRLRKAGTRASEIVAADARLRAARARVQTMREHLAELVVRAPQASVVETIDLRPGDLVAPNAPTVNLLLTDSLYVRAFVPEARLDRVRLGMTVPVALDALAGQRVQTVVSFISSQAEFTPRNVQTPEERSKQVFRVKLSLVNAPKEVRAGMLGDVRFDEATP